MTNPKAYRAMFRFLSERYKQLPSDELAMLLSSMSLDTWADGTLGDPGLEDEWDRAVEAVEQEEAAGKLASPFLQKAS